MSDEAASKIQRAWKRSFRSVMKILAEYVDPVQEIEKGLQFREFMAFLKRLDVVVGMKNLLKRVVRMRVGHRIGQGRVAEVKINTRVFMFCFMVKFFPDNMFPDANEPNAQALRQASENVLKHWYEIIDALKRNEIPDNLEFRKSLVKYDEKFTLILTQRVQLALHTLYTVRANLDYTHAAIPALNEQIRDLRERLSIIPGGAERLEAENAYERVLLGPRLPYE